MDVEEIKRRLKAANISQKQVAEKLGIVPNKVSLSLTGKRQFKVREMDIIRGMLDGDPVPSGPSLRAIPIIGQVAAGNWREAVSKPLASMPQPDPTIPARAFALRVDGDSMDELVDDSGVVIVDPDDRDLYPGRYYVVLNGDNETTFKRFEINPARLVPCSSNEAHRPISIGTGEGFEVVGRVIWRASRM